MRRSQRGLRQYRPRSQDAARRGCATAPRRRCARPRTRPNTARALEATIEESDGLIRTFNALLMIARAESGQARDDMVEFDAAEIARDVGELYEPLAEEKGLTLKVEAEMPAPSRAIASWSARRSPTWSTMPSNTPRRRPSSNGDRAGNRRGPVPTGDRSCSTVARPRAGHSGKPTAAGDRAVRAAGAEPLAARFRARA